MGGDKKESWEEYAEKIPTTAGETVDPVVAPANPDATPPAIPAV